MTAGTDAPINPYGLSLLMELENYASGGLTPVGSAAHGDDGVRRGDGRRRRSRQHRAGQARGSDVVIDGNPLENIKDLRRVRRVMKDGNVYDVSSLVAGR